MSSLQLNTPGVASTTAAPTGGTQPQNQREQLAAAAKQFEAIFVRQMLSAARKTDFGGEKLFDSQAMGTFRQMQDERVADTVANTGAFGLAKMIEARLAQMLPAEKPAEGAVTEKGKTNGL